MYIMEKAYRLDMVEEAVSEMDLFDVADDIMESDENYQIVISGWQAYVPELGLALHAGVFCQYDESEQAYLPDFSVTVIKEAEERMKETKEGDWLYYEQDGFVITLANYLHGKMEISRIEQLSCFICIPDEEGTEILKS
ncbi:hypothetical protein [Acetatifactor muris]|uniref:hypothetical protein n=1 Tax=Acetatifactor muris TaxID=879566 RepID=UPI0023F0B185|nr:hypothetical protein [Acetatifactor muris]